MGRRLSRRAFLGGGAAVALGLPWLEAMLPRRARAAADCPKRFFALFTPNGMPMGDWTPNADGAGYDLPLALEGLGTFSVQDQVSVLTGLQNSATDGPAGHAPASAGFLTGTGVAQSQTMLGNTSSVDQVYAQNHAGQTPVSSLVLGMMPANSTGGCDAGGYGCAHLNNVSWDGEVPIPQTTDPQVAFDLLFAGMDSGATTAELARRKANRLSVLDSVIEEAKSLQGGLGATDKAKVEEYLESVRDLELRVQSDDPSQSCNATAPPVEYQHDKKATAMLDVVAMAFQCDRTRSSTFMIGRGLTSLSFFFLGISQGHHSMSHNLGDPVARDGHLKVAQWEVDRFAYLVDRLRSMDEGGVSVLDNSILYLGNEISNGGAHSRTNLPVLLAGGGALGLSPGRHVQYGGSPPVANMFVAILNALDVGVTSFGDDGTAPLGQL